MRPRPNSLGAKVSVDSLEDVDRVLEEIAFCESEIATRNDIIKRRTDAVKAEQANLSVVEIDGESISVGDRLAYLKTVLSDWISSSIREHLPEDRKSIELPHGTIGLRQQPLSLTIGENSSEEKIVENIDKKTDGLIGKVRAFALKAIKSLGVVFGDLVTVSIKVNWSRLRQLAAEGQLTKKAAQSLGITINDPYDAPTINAKTGPANSGE